MGKALPAAILAALLVSIFVNLVALNLKGDGSGDFLRRAEEAEKAVLASDEKVDVMVRRLESMERRLASERRAGQAAAASDGDTAAPGMTTPDGAERPLAPDGTPYISQTELDEAVKKAISDRFPGTDPNWTPEPPKPPQTLEEVALEMGLTAGEEAQLRIIMRESEEEMLTNLFGDRSIPEIKADIQAAKEDPEKLSQLMQSVVMRGFSRAGYLMTWEKRRKKEIKDLLGEEKARDFNQHRVEPIHGREVEDFLNDLGD